MGETDAAGFTDLCLVTAVGIEFKIAAGLLTAKSFSEEPPSERRRPCLRGSAQEHLDEPGRQGRLPSQDFSEEPPSERRRPCLRNSAQEHLDEPGRQGRLPSQDFSEG